ncbi:Metallo-dependent phosphatase [Auriculariales sp. MPI-PUGE-AT-0066]|nr:Metallo-dependent phosphatase [Auriculariales sp. MPI-PUGE-AT-0066]
MSLTTFWEYISLGSTASARRVCHCSGGTTSALVFDGTPQRPLLDVLNPYPGKPKLTFRADGSFKLMVMSDLHMGENQDTDWGPEQDVNTTRVMRRVLKDEKPDYVAISGDLITGENTFAENSTKYIDMIALPLNEARVPFSSIHGNHDNQINITHMAEIERERKVAPLSYTRAAPKGVGGEQGPGNYWVPIYRSKRDSSPSLILWFFDSRGGITSNSTQQNQIDLPDWVDESVVPWMKSELEKQEKAWGPSTTRASLAFVHIPPHIVEALQDGLNSTESPGLDEDNMGGGSTQSTVRTDIFGSGRDGPFWSSLFTLPNLLSVVSGHDHGCEWCATASSSSTGSASAGASSVRFCFAKHTGYGGYGQHEWGYGVRLFEFVPQHKGIRALDNGMYSVKTWIRLEEGEVRAKMDLGAYKLH